MNLLKLYERLTYLYPNAYRRQYGPQMVQTLADMLADQPTARGKATVWLRSTADLPLTILSQNTLALGENVMQETPHFIKRNGLVASILLLPFVAALLANSLDATLNNHTLYHSWLWSTPVLTTWVLVLPILACALALASYLRYVTQRTPRTSLRQRAIDLKRVWPVLLTGLFGLGVLFILAFHDSAHCWAQNPVHFVTRFHQTWQCTTQGFLGGR